MSYTNERDGQEEERSCPSYGGNAEQETVAGAAERDSPESCGDAVEGPRIRVGRKEAFGFVYFVETENGEYVKIGFSVTPVTRLTGLSTNSPFRLRLLGYMPGSHNTERHLHRRFAAHRKNGEWFHNSEALQRFIRGMALIKPDDSDDDWQPAEELELLTWESLPEDPQNRPREEMLRLFFKMAGREGGLRGGPARAKALSPERRREIAQKAAAKRWSRS